MYLNFSYFKYHFKINLLITIQTFIMFILNQVKFSSSRIRMKCNSSFHQGRLDDDDEDDYTFLFCVDFPVLENWHYAILVQCVMNVGIVSLIE